MSKEKIFIYLVLFFFLVVISLKVFDPDLGIIYALEELAFMSAILFGFIIFHKNIENRVKQIDSRFPWEKDRSKRLLENVKVWFLYTLIIGSIISVFIYLYLQNFELPISYRELLEEKKKQSGFKGPPKMRKDWRILAHSFSFTSLLFIMLFSIEEFFLFNERKTKEQVNIQKIQKEQALMKANVLKKQLNPHFMFNTLNVLSGLIHEDIEKSDKFIKELSKIYRYVLEQSEKTLSTLEQEIEFIESYFYLLKIRFEEKLQYNVRVPNKYLGNKVPSLLLELLVENAIKHNIISKKSPLQIDIYIQDNRLIVSNNLQLRDAEVQSTRKGISNLQERLELLGIQDSQFGIKEPHYVASIPLLNP